MTHDELIEAIYALARDYLNTYDGIMSGKERKRYPQVAAADDALTEIDALIERYRVLGERKSA